MTVQKLTKAQIENVRKFQKRWGEFMGLLGLAFFGPDTQKSVEAGDSVIDGIEEAIFDTVRVNCRNTLDLDRLVMIFGHIAGDRFGRHLINNDLALDQSYPVSAADRFEAAYRVGLEERLVGKLKKRPRLYAPDGGLLN